MKQYLLSASLILMFINLGNPCTLGSIPFKNAQTDPNSLPQVPDALAVPSGQDLLLKAAAKGVQIYTCRAKSQAQTEVKSEAQTAYEWTLKAPSAELFNDQGQPLGKHYAGPTWEINRSKVVGAVSAKVNAPQEKAIPWLLLKAKSHQGQGILNAVNWVQRLDTIGGKAPALGCDEAHPKAEVQVPYTANYYFYRVATP